MSWSALIVDNKPILKLGVANSRAKTAMPVKSSVEISMEDCGTLVCSTAMVRDGAGDLAKDLEYWETKGATFPERRHRDHKSKQFSQPRERYASVHIESLPDTLSWSGDLNSLDENAKQIMSIINTGARESHSLSCLMVVDGRKNWDDLQRWMGLCHNIQKRREPPSPPIDDAQRVRNTLQRLIDEQEERRNREKQSEESAGEENIEEAEQEQANFEDIEAGGPSKKQKIKDQHEEDKSAAYSKLQELRKITEGLKPIEEITDEEIVDKLDQVKLIATGIELLGEKLKDATV